jgi:hypothetical protein
MTGELSKGMEEVFLEECFSFVTGDRTSMKHPLRRTLVRLVILLSFFYYMAIGNIAFK